jgi:phage terminase large subunit
MGTLRIPDKLQPLFSPKRYKIMYGGRGGGKSWAAAGVLLVMAAQKPLRVLCTREIQKSMRESVYRLLCDRIQDIGLGWFYTVTETEIRGQNGSLFVFSGLQDHTVESIKSYEGIDIVWVEEAQTVGRKSWTILIPTIRKRGSEIWVTLNPDMEEDDTYQRFVGCPESDDLWRTEINWNDNPWFPETLELERVKCQKLDPDDYPNIWEGKPKRTADGAIYPHEIEALYSENRIRDVPYDPILPVHTVWDLGYNDAMSIGFIQRGPTDIRVIDHIEDDHKALDWYVGEIEKRPYRWGTDFLPHDGQAKSQQTGKSTQQLLREMGRKNVVCLSLISVEEGIKQARMLFPKCYFDKGKTTRLIECLKRYRRDIDRKTGEARLPLHDEYSHSADMWRYVAMAVPFMSNDDYEYAPEPPKDWRLL